MIPTQTSSDGRSVFWAVWSVFLVLVFLQGYYLVEDFRQRSQINASRAQLQKPLASARTINQTTEGIGRDLIALAPQSAEASKIISEFKIQVNTPPQQAPAK